MHYLLSLSVLYAPLISSIDSIIPKIIAVREDWFMNHALIKISCSHSCGHEDFSFLCYTPCRPLEVNRRFGGTRRLHFQGRRTSQERNQHEASSKQNLLHADFLLGLFFDPVEATCSTETSVDFQQTTRRCIPGGISLCAVCYGL
jgi:hypothetical protein